MAQDKLFCYFHPNTLIPSDTPSVWFTGETGLKFPVECCKECQVQYDKGEMDLLKIKRRYNFSTWYNQRVKEVQAELKKRVDERLKQLKSSNTTKETNTIRTKDLNSRNSSE